MANTRVIDADFHFYEGPEKLIEYFSEPWKTRFEDGGVYSMTTFYPNFTGDTRMGGRIKRENHPAAMDSEDIDRAFGELGIDQALLLSDLILVMQDINTADDRSIALANASVDYMIDNILDASKGRYSAIPVPFNQPEASVELIERVGNLDEFVGIYIVTGGAEPPLGHRQYEPIYEIAEEKDLPVVFHSGASGLDNHHTAGFEKFLSTHTLGFMEANMEQLTSILVQGIPEKFPDLEFLFLESGLFWVPAMMNRLDASYMSRPSEAPLLDRRPSKYMRDQFYFGTQPLEDTARPEHLEYLFELIGGTDRVIFSSDYPHWDYDDPDVILNNQSLSAQEKEDILYGNAAKLFGI